MLISSTSSNSLIQTLNNLFIQSTDNNLQHDIESIIHSNNMNQDNISIWNSDLTTLCSDLVRIFLNSGLKLPASVVNAIVEESTIKSLLLKNKQYGNNKINTLDTCFQNIIHALSCLLTRGCESGAVSINLDLLLPVLTTILSLNIRADINNAKDKVLNENGLSTVDLAAMVPKLKVHSLRLLSTLLSTRNPALLRFSSALSDPLLSMLLDADCIQIDSSLAIPVLSALTGCIKAYPTIVLRGSAHKSLQVVLEQFRTIVGAVTQSRTSVVYSASTHTGMHSSTTEPISEDMTAVESWYGNESDVTEGHNNNSTSGNYNNRLSTLSSSFFLSTIFTDYFTCFSHTIEALLLYSGPMLPTKMREYIEITLTQALLCLQKGVLPLQPPNRHLKRSLSPEVLRQSSTLQSLIIQLCMTDVLTPGADGIVSGNMTLLRSVCQSCLLQSDTSLQAVRTLCVIDAVLFPSAVTLPANHHVHLNRKLTQMNDSGTSAYAVSISESNTNSGNNGDSMTVGVKPSLLSSKKITTATAKAKKNATTTGNNNTGETSLTSTSTTTAAVGVTFKRSSEVINVTSSTGSSSQKGIELVTIQGSQSTATSNSRSKKAKVIDEDGELELPDIQF